MTLTDKPPTEQADAGRPTRSALARPQIVGGGVLIFIGALWLLERIGALDISLTAVLAMGTMVVGVSLIVLSRYGPHGGLIVFGSLLALVTFVTAAAPFEGFQGGVGDRTYAVDSAGQIRPDYNLAMGKLTIDLRSVDDLPSTATLKASVGMGELLIRVPQGTAVDVQANIGAGQLEIFGKTTDGVGIDESYRSPDFASSTQRISMELQAFTGRVEVSDG